MDEEGNPVIHTYLYTICLSSWIKIMSFLSIEPLNISGISVPTNFLDTILGQSINYTKLVYPMDLATNPQYNHAIQFSVHDYTYPQIESEFQKFKGFASGVMSDISSSTPSIPLMADTGTVKGIPGKLASATKNLASGLWNNRQTMAKEAGNMVNNVLNTNISSVGNSVIEKANAFMNNAPGETLDFLSKNKTLLQPGNYSPRTDNVLAYISLYMPDTLSTQVQSQYDPVEKTSTFGIGGYLGNLVSDVMKSKAANQSNPSNLFGGEDYVRGLFAKGAGLASKESEKMTGLMQNALQRVPNPQVQLIYRGLDLRQFQFEFIFTPASSKEAEEVDEIVKTFMFYSLPDITTGSGQYFIPPQIFKIKFAFLGDEGVSGQIYDIFKQNITNVFGNQFNKMLTGSNPTTDIAKNNKAKLFSIGDCFLQNVQVNYAPLGTWAAYQDGYPIQTSLSLTFQEISLINKTTPGVQPKDTSAYSSSKTGYSGAFSEDAVKQATADVKNLSALL